MTTRTNTAKWTGTRWRIDVQKDGTRKSFYSSTPGRTGQREANAKADKWLQTGVTDTTMRVRQAYGLWYAAQQETTSEGNCRNIATRWRCWIEPNIGNKKLSALTEQDLQNIVNKAYAAGLSKKTLSCLCSDLRALCKFCRAAKLTTFNPEGLRVPAGARLKGKKVLQPVDLLTLFNVDTTLYKDQTVTDDYINAYRFQVLTGLRPGELMGLQWPETPSTCSGPSTCAERSPRARTRTPSGPLSCLPWPGGCWKISGRSPGTRTACFALPTNSTIISAGKPTAPPTA